MLCRSAAYSNQVSVADLPHTYIRSHICIYVLGANVGIFNIRCVAAPSPCPMWVQVAFCMVGYLVTVAGYLGQVCWSRCGQIWAAPPSAFG